VVVTGSFSPGKAPDCWRYLPNAKSSRSCREPALDVGEGFIFAGCDILSRMRRLVQEKYYTL
jgi:hypothetical protein